jgi:hypothetical protein
MADRCKVYIDAVHTELAKAELHGSAVPYVVGRLHWNANGAPPLVKWARGDIDHSEPKKQVGENPTIYDRNQQLAIRVWAEADERVDKDASEAAADTLLTNVLRACRIVSGSASLRIGRFSWVTEDKPGWLNRGAALEGFVVVDLPIPSTDVEVVRVMLTSQMHTRELDVPE